MDMGTMLAGLLRNLGVRPEMFAQIGATVAQADNKLDRIIAQNIRILELLEGCEIAKAPGETFKETEQRFLNEGLSTDKAYRKAIANGRD